MKLLKMPGKRTNEVLFIKSGRVQIDFFDDNQIYLESRILEQGDVILLATGGHGFEMLEQSGMIEVKQVPYAGEGDKTRFEGRLPENLKYKRNLPHEESCERKR